MVDITARNADAASPPAILPGVQNAGLEAAGGFVIWSELAKVRITGRSSILGFFDSR
jgi:hypothetical protein